LNQQNTVPKRKTNKRRTRRRQPEKTKQKNEEAWITIYLNKKRDKTVFRGDINPKKNQIPPPIVEE
jgi:hypothetical protein